MKRFRAFQLAGAMLFCGTLSGCTSPASSATALAVDLGRTSTDFAVRLLQAGDEPGENVLFSPVCLLAASTGTYFTFTPRSFAMRLPK